MGRSGARVLVVMTVAACGSSAGAPALQALRAGDGRVFVVRGGALHQRLESDLTSPWATVITPVAVSSIAAQPGRWWLLGEDTVFVSADAGLTWSLVGSPPRLQRPRSWPDPGPGWRQIEVQASGAVLVNGADGLVAWHQGQWKTLFAADPAGASHFLAVRDDAYVLSATTFAGADGWLLYCGTGTAAPLRCDAGLPAADWGAAWRVGVRGDGTFLVGAPGGVFAQGASGWTQVWRGSPADPYADLPDRVGSAPTSPSDLTVVRGTRDTLFVDASGLATPVRASVEDIAPDSLGRLWTAGLDPTGAWVEVIDASGASRPVPRP